MIFRSSFFLVAWAAIVTAGARVGYSTASHYLGAGQHQNAKTAHELVEQLAKRAREVWQLRENHDYAAVYDFLQPSFRETFSREDFANARGFLLYSDASLQSSELIGTSRGRTIARVAWKPRNYLYTGPAVPKTALAEEHWIHDGRDWQITGLFRWFDAAARPKREEDER